MSRQLVIVGTGLFAEVALAYFEEFTDYKVAAFACHARFMQGNTIHDRPLHAVEAMPEAFPPSEYDVFVAIGYGRMNRMRQRVYEEVKTLGYRCATFVHPTVKIWSSTTLGDNVFIFEDNTIQPFTRIGNDTILWSGNHLGHHSSVGNHCFIASHVVISGSCTVGNNVFIGVNATFHDSLTIADDCLIGAGAVISKSTKAKEVFVPASTKPFPKNSEEIGF